MNSIPSSTNWNDLPCECKMKVIENLDFDDRKLLRACSFDDKNVVDSTKLKFVPAVMIKIRNKTELYMDVYKSSRVQEKKTFRARSSQKLEKIWQKQLRDVTKMTFLTILLGENLENFDFLKIRENRLKVENLEIQGTTSMDCHFETVKNILEYIDPVYLKSLEINPVILNDAIFETEHVRNAEKLKINNGCIREDQLSNLKATDIRLADPKVITANSVNQLIKRFIETPKSSDFKLQITDTRNIIDFHDIINDFPIVEQRSGDGEQQTIVRMVDPEYQLLIEETVYGDNLMKVVKITREPVEKNSIHSNQ